MNVVDLGFLSMNKTFADKLISWQLKHGRHELPWQGTNNPYAIWVAEVMLQQTQVATVIPYYQRFMQVFPNIRSLAKAPIEKVLALWSGLGYYARGRNLHQAACQIMVEHRGKFPRNMVDLQRLPGIGRSTAAAVSAFAFGECCTILDGNVKRILARYFGIAGCPGERAVEARLWQIAESLLPENSNRKTMVVYTQALMDLGALVCVRSRPHCQQCPLQNDCVAHGNNQTAILPTAKVKKLLPVKQAVHLIIINQNRILLERRPVSGIWGGLWCFPEMPVEHDGMNYCQRNLNMRVTRFCELPRLNHTFTHFKLSIYPQIMQLVAHELVCEENNHVWKTIDDAEKLAIPTPVKKLLSLTEAVFRSSNHV
jgi:A/G-specific adenine glycosylase